MIVFTSGKQSEGSLYTALLALCITGCSSSSLNPKISEQPPAKIVLASTNAAAAKPNLPAQETRVAVCDKLDELIKYAPMGFSEIKGAPQTTGSRFTTGFYLVDADDCFIDSGFGQLNYRCEWVLEPSREIYERLNKDVQSCFNYNGDSSYNGVTRSRSWFPKNHPNIAMFTRYTKSRGYNRPSVSISVKAK